MRPGDARELLVGAIDLHVHTHPNLFLSAEDDVDVARTARELGMRAIVVKNHHMGTSARAYYAQKGVPGIQVFGGVVLNRYLGGLNPYAVEAELQYGGRLVWMPTVTAAHHLRHFGKAGFPVYGTHMRPVEGITVLDRDGKLVPDLKEIFDLVAEADAVLATGHLAIEETRVLVPAARAAGVRKLLVTHANLGLTKVPIGVCKELVAQGAVIEYCFLPLTPLWHSHTPQELLGWIRELGAQHVVLSSDIGNYYNPSPPEAFRLFLETMLTVGATSDEIVAMTHTNPAQLLGLSS